MDQETQTTTRRSRSPGRRYPGASLARVLQVAALIGETGDRMTVGTLAGRLNASERASKFQRLLVSLIDYGIAEWSGDGKRVLQLTDDGRSAVNGSDEDRGQVLQRALVRPGVFREVAERFAGRQVPDERGLAEYMTTIGVAASAANLAARNFRDSAIAAGVLGSG